MAIKDKTSTTQGQGFDASKRPHSSQQSDSGANQALALADGLQSTLLAQAGSLGELARQTDLAAESIAAPIVQFCSSVVNGDLLMAKIAEGLQQSQARTLEAEVKVAPPEMPSLPVSKVTPNFFGKPKHISLPNS